MVFYVLGKVVREIRLLYAALIANKNDLIFSDISPLKSELCDWACIYVDIYI